MKTLQEIKALIDRGSYRLAHRAIDEVLALGPNNLKMLKLKALLYAQEGRVDEEFRLWLQVIDTYQYDDDAFDYFQQLDYEERLNFYFSDYLPGGGRRFLAHPQSVVNASFFGVFGCILFLVIHSYASYYHLLALPVVSIAFFVLLVAVPWLAIIVVYLRSLREVTLTGEGISFASKLRRISLPWTEVAGVYFVHSASAYTSSLVLRIQPRGRFRVAIELDLGRESTPIRARSFFVREVCRHVSNPHYIKRELLAVGPSKAISF